MKKVLIPAIMVASLLLSAGSASAASQKVMWGKTELKQGQIGKVTILGTIELVKINTDGSLSVIRNLNKGEEYRVYSFKNEHGGLYGVGGGSFVQKNPSEVKYETPSKSKLAELEKESTTFDKVKVINALASNGFYKYNEHLVSLNPFDPGGSGYTGVLLGTKDPKNMVLEILAWEDKNIPESNIIPGKVKFVLDQMIPSGSSQIYGIVSQTAVTGYHKDLNETFTFNGLKTKVTFDDGKITGRPILSVVFSIE
ncbi:hypothetical protein [Bacillus sp. FJAT-29937]|uniref:hypothetical protein n=1 Tax=Bacillus sp. FJAT-29937 TaxID=1720553 RepID=UPI0008302F7C|nr:hypothetical protein [Bacillus sp. FJAT-29937]